MNGWLFDYLLSRLDDIGAENASTLAEFIATAIQDQHDQPDENICCTLVELLQETLQNATQLEHATQLEPVAQSIAREFVAAFRRGYSDLPPDDSMQRTMLLGDGSLFIGQQHKVREIIDESGGVLTLGAVSTLDNAGNAGSLVDSNEAADVIQEMGEPEEVSAELELENCYNEQLYWMTLLEHLDHVLLNDFKCSGSGSGSGSAGFGPEASYQALTQAHGDVLTAVQLLLHAQTLVDACRPCKYMLSGRCYRKDCFYQHDVAGVPCRYWLASQCVLRQQEQDGTLGPDCRTCPFCTVFPSCLRDTSS